MMRLHYAHPIIMPKGNDVDDLCQGIARSLEVSEKHMVVTHVWVPEHARDEVQRQFPGLTVMAVRGDQQGWRKWKRVGSSKW